MKMKAKISLLLILTLIMGLLAGCQQEPIVEPDYEDNQTLLIGAWVAPPPEFMNDKSYQEVAESGINAIYSLYGGDDMKALALAEKYGIRYMVYDRGLGGIPEEDHDLIPQMLEKFEGKTSLIGHLAVDEPGPAKFEQLAALRKVYDRCLPDALFYVNLLPTYSSLAQRGGLTYKEYVRQYLEVVKPDVLSFDHYPLKIFNGETSITEDYLLNLEIISKEAKAAGVPFWCFLQTMAYGLSNRSPDYDDLRWQAYTSLAFGARGLQHFCYWTPTDGSESFGDAMIDRQGNKTPIYDYASQVNHELLAFDHIYLSYESVGQMVFPKDNAPLHTYMEEPLESFAPIKSVEGGPVLIGCFEDKDGNLALMLVNMTDPGKDEAVTVTITFNDARALNIYTQGVKERVNLEGGKIEIELASGEGKFIQILK
jgi:hypothetical protein